MLTAKVNDQKAEIGIKGNVEEFSVEVTLIITAIYQRVRSKEEEEAAAFKDMIQTLVQDGSPIWDNMSLRLEDIKEEQK